MPIINITMDMMNWMTFLFLIDECLYPAEKLWICFREDKILLFPEDVLRSTEEAATISFMNHCKIIVAVS